MTTLYNADTTVRIMHGICSCHNASITRKDSDDEWMHSDESFADTFHVHFESESSDCDGRYSRQGTYTLANLIASGWERPSWRMGADMPDHDDLWQWIAPVPQMPHREYGSVTVAYGPDSIAVTIGHEEGGSHSLYLACDRATCCDHVEWSHRDHSAERAGY